MDNKIKHFLGWLGHVLDVIVRNLYCHTSKTTESVANLGLRIWDGCRDKYYWRWFLYHKAHLFLLISPRLSVFSCSGPPSIKQERHDTEPWESARFSHRQMVVISFMFFVRNVMIPFIFRGRIVRDCQRDAFFHAGTWLMFSHVWHWCRRKRNDRFLLFIMTSMAVFYIVLFFCNYQIVFQCSVLAKIKSEFILMDVKQWPFCCGVVRFSIIMFWWDYILK